MNDTTSEGLRKRMAALLLLAVTLVVYWPVHTHGFINFDDPDYVSSNPRVQGGVTVDSIRWAFTESHSSNWHPITWISHMLDCQFFGVNAGAHHLVNLVFHLLNTVFIALWLYRMTGAWWRSWSVAALFALHPLHVESVAWISERKDVLSAFFGLLTLMAYARYAKPQASPSPPRSGKVRGDVKNLSLPSVFHSLSSPWYWAALIFFALGLMSKPMLVTWPFVLLLLDVWPLNRMAKISGAANPRHAQSAPGFDWAKLRPLFIEKIPFFVLTIAASIATSLVQRGAGATVPLDVLPLDVRVANMVMSYVRYLSKTLWPENLAVFYPYVITPWDSPALWLGIGLLVAITWLCWNGSGRFPAGLVGWCWFLGTFIPVIGLVQVGRQGMADRYTYIPHIGLFIVIVWGAAELLGRWKSPRGVPAALALAALVGCAVVTSRQVAHWQSTATLASHTVSVTKDNFIAHTQYATTLLEAGKLSEALAECDAALRIMPDYAEAFNTRGAVFLRQGNLAAARTNYQNAAQFDAKFPDPHHALADLALRQGQFVEAETHSRAALAIAPMHLGARYTLAQALHGQGKLDDAIAAYQELDRLKSGVFHVHRGLASLYVLKGNLPAATGELRSALAIVPNNPETLNALGTVLLDQGDVLGASNQFSAVLNLQPTNGIANFKIGQLLTVAKRERDSIPFYRTALKAWPDSVEALNNLAWLLAASADPQIRNGVEAVKLAARACELTGHREPMLLGTLAAAHAEAGQFTDAVRVAEQAIALAHAANQSQIVQRNQELLELYRAGKPYHEPAN
jgi:tetratricopeptide (TPR) repeat protein